MEAGSKVPPPPEGTKTVVHGPYLFPVQGTGGGSLTAIEIDDSEVLEVMDYIVMGQSTYADNVPGYTSRLDIAYGASDWERYFQRFPAPPS